LLADDQDDIREMAHSVLKARVYHVLLAQDGEEALAAFRAHRDRISLVLLDMIMPKRSGSELFAAIKALKPDASVLFTTGYTNETAASADFVARGVAGLRKPYSPSALYWRVRAVLDASGKSPEPNRE
jgi:DNA-binding response OmpR family regulator